MMDPVTFPAFNGGGHRHQQARPVFLVNGAGLPPPPPWGFFYHHPVASRGNSNGSGGNNNNNNNGSRHHQQPHQIFPPPMGFVDHHVLFGTPPPPPPPPFLMRHPMEMHQHHPVHQQRMQPMKLLARIPRNVFRFSRGGRALRGGGGGKVSPLLANDGCKKVSIIRRIREIFLRAVGDDGRKSATSDSFIPLTTVGFQCGGFAAPMTTTTTVPRTGKQQQQNRPPMPSSSSPVEQHHHHHQHHNRRHHHGPMTMTMRPHTLPAPRPPPGNRVFHPHQHGNNNGRNGGGGGGGGRGIVRRPRIQQRPLPNPTAGFRPGIMIRPGGAASENGAASAAPTYDRLVFNDGEEDDDDGGGGGGGVSGGGKLTSNGSSSSASSPSSKREGNKSGGAAADDGSDGDGGKRKNRPTSDEGVVGTEDVVRTRAQVHTADGDRRDDGQVDWDAQSLFWSFSSVDQLYNNISGRCFSMFQPRKMIPPPATCGRRDDQDSDDQAYSSIEDDASSGSHHYYCPIFADDETANNNNNKCNSRNVFDPRHHRFARDDLFAFDENLAAAGVEEIYDDFYGVADDDDDDEEEEEDDEFLFGGGNDEFCRCQACASRPFRRYGCDPCVASSATYALGQELLSGRRRPRGVLVDDVPHRWRRQPRKVSLDVRLDEARRFSRFSADHPSNNNNNNNNSNNREKADVVNRRTATAPAASSGTPTTENPRQDTVEFFTNPRRHVRRGTLDVVVTPKLTAAMNAAARDGSFEQDAPAGDGDGTQQERSTAEGVVEDETVGCGAGKHCACCPNGNNNNNNNNGKHEKGASKVDRWPWNSDDELAWRIWSGRKYDRPISKLSITDWELSNVKERTKRILTTTPNNNGPASFGTTATFASSKSWNLENGGGQINQNEADKKPGASNRNFKRKTSSSTWDHHGPIDRDLMSIFDESETAPPSRAATTTTTTLLPRIEFPSSAAVGRPTKKAAAAELDDGEDDPIGAGLREDDRRLLLAVARTGSNDSSASSDGKQAPHQDGGNKGKDDGAAAAPSSSSQHSDSGWESGGSCKRAAWNESTLAAATATATATATAVGVSRQGDLSIDYSCSWKSLDQHWSLFV